MLGNVLAILTTTGKAVLGVEVTIVAILFIILIFLCVRIVKNKKLREKALLKSKNDAQLTSENDALLTHEKAAQLASKKVAKLTSKKTAQIEDDTIACDDISVVAKEELQASESCIIAKVVDDTTSIAKNELQTNESCIIAKDEPQTDEQFIIAKDELQATAPPTPSLEEAFADFNGKDLDEGNESVDLDEIDERNDLGEKLNFENKMKASSACNRAMYNAVKNEIMSYKNIKSRVTNGGDYFRIPGKQIVKIVLIGKTMRIALALDPHEFDYNIYHQKDRSSMKKYADTPMFVKVQTRLGVSRATLLIAELMQKNGTKKAKVYRIQDYAQNL